MKIINVTREKTKIVTTHEKQDPKSKDKRIFTETAHEAPLAGFDPAMDALIEAVSEQFDVSPEWVENITIEQLSVSYTDAGSRTVTIKFNRKFSKTKKAKSYTTVGFKIDDPLGEDTADRCCSVDVARDIENLLAEAERYINGERMQQLLPLSTVEEDDGASEGDPLPFEDDTENLFDIGKAIKEAKTQKSIKEIVLDQTGEELPKPKGKVSIVQLKEYALQFIANISD